MDFAALPPEINSGRMYTGAGSGPMVSAAAAWSSVAAELNAAAAGYWAEVSGLTGGVWLGPASLAMASAAASYTAWLSSTAEQAQQTAVQAVAAVAAYEAAFAATVPPLVIAENRMLLLSLVATNIFGQNTPAIAVTEAQYAEMWAQDATAMYGYASSSAAAAKLSSFTPPPQSTNPAGVDAQSAAVGQAAGSAATTSTPAMLAQLMSEVPTALQGLASGDSIALQADLLNYTSGWTFIVSGVLFILGPMLTGPIAGALPTAASLSGSELAGCDAAAPLAGDAPAATRLVGAELAASPDRGAVLAGAGRAVSIGRLSVPPAWAGAAPAIGRAATALPELTLAGFPAAEADVWGSGYGGMLPGSLMAAAAGGGGAAGGGWAATRAGRAGSTRAQPAALSGAVEHPGNATPQHYGRVPAVIPAAARPPVPHHPGHADYPAQVDPGPGSAELAGQIHELRQQISQLAMERDVLMRSLALWAKEPTGH